MERTEWGQRRYPERRSLEHEGRASPNWVSGPWRQHVPWTREGLQSRKRYGIHTKKFGKRKQTRGRRRGKNKKKKMRILGKGIYNLSDVQFSKEELEVLDLGLKFAPDKPLDKFEVYIDLQKFMRKLNIKKHFAMNTDNRIKENSEYIQTNLRNNSIFNLKMQGNQCMGAFKKIVEDDLRDLEKKNRKTKNIWRTIKQIGKKHEVVIRPADGW